MPKNMKFALAASRIYQTPLLISEDAGSALAYTFQDVIAAKSGADQQAESPDIAILEDREIYEIVDDKAIIRIVGPLVHRHDWMATFCGFVAYERIIAHCNAARTDPRVKRAFIEFDTPGGEVRAMVEAADAIRALAEEKETIAVVNDVCASAGYALAAQCTRIVVSPTSIVGSIGVVMMHRDYSGAEEMMGVKTTLYFKGDRKVDGNPYGPMDEAAIKATSERQQHYYELLCETIGSGGGARLNKQAAMDTQAALFVGADAVASGLADSVGYLEETLRSEPGEFPTKPQTQEVEMADNKTPEQIAAAEQAVKDKATTDANAKAITDGAAAAVTADRERMSAIKGLDEANDKPKLADHLALSGMSVDDAKGVLENAAVETAGENTATIPGSKEFEERAKENAAETNIGNDLGGTAPDGQPQGNVHSLADMQRQKYGMK